MNSVAFGLTAIPPIIGIVLEAINPIRPALIERSVRDTLEEFDRYRDFDTLVEDVTKITEGAVSTAGLGPTIVAAFSGGYVIINESPRAYLVGALYGAAFLILIIFTLFLLLGSSFHAIADEYLILRIKGKARMQIRRKTIISCIIYAVNLVILALNIMVYSFSPQEEESRLSKAAEVIYVSSVITSTRMVLVGSTGSGDP